VKTKKKAEHKPLKKQTSDEYSLSNPWTIRGITMEARNAAQMAAKKNNEFVGSWISRIILEAAQNQLTAKQEVARPEDVQDMLSTIKLEFLEEIKNINTRISAISQRRSLLSSLLGR